MKKILLVLTCCLSVIILFSFSAIEGYTFLAGSSADLPEKGNPDPSDIGVVRAFPKAVGFGTGTPGGRGGKVIYVTNLRDSGPGSLRAALAASGPRTVLFRVSGTIDLERDIVITRPFLTVAGQTAPGEGVQIRGGQLKIGTHDVVIRYLKIRAGDVRGTKENADRDAITVNQENRAYNIVIDHTTLIWGPDIGGISFLNDARDATISYSIIGEGLFLSKHPEGVSIRGGHSMAMNITELDSTDHPTRITVHHNLLTTSSDRNPRVIGGENIDIVNNVIYNWHKTPSQGNPRSVNLINNFYIKGPMTTKKNSLVAWLPRLEEGGSFRNGVVFESGNLAEGFYNLRGNPQSVYTNSLFLPYSIPEEDSPREAYAKIIADAGASLQVAGIEGEFQPVRDRVDRQIINNLMTRSGSFVNGQNKNGLDGFAEANWPVLAAGMPARDEDLDGMPDIWEVKYFGDTDRGEKRDSSGDFDGDGYTDLEEYLNQTDPTK